MFVALLAFFSRISDPRFGGTYITLLNTITNLGCTWTSTVALGMIDLLTFRVCTTDSKNYCSTPHEVVVRLLLNLQLLIHGPVNIMKPIDFRWVL